MDPIHNMKQSIAIIGGGAAGMMAGAVLIENNTPADIHLFDANKNLGVKVIISGGGRCNVTTGITNQNTLKKHYTRGIPFLNAALSKFSPQKCYEWFESRGVPLKNESDNRVFPQSDDGKDIVGVFEKLFHKKITIHFQSRVKHIQKMKDRFAITTENSSHTVDYVVIATGGNAYRKTGSQGDGYHFAESLGHSITPLGPSLNSFFTEEQWPKNVSGIALPNATLSFKKTSVTGPFLFTHFGISGPSTFALSSHLAFEKISKQSPLTITLHVDKSIPWKSHLANNATNGKKQIKTLLSQKIPKRLTNEILTLSNIEQETKLADIPTENRKKLFQYLNNGFELTLTARRPGDEFVTAGGVNTDEINPQTMESLITPKLYFAGEVMDIDGVTGGFNLQSSWATGHLAGKSISKTIKKLTKKTSLIGGFSL